METGKEGGGFRNQKEINKRRGSLSVLDKTGRGEAERGGRSEGCLLGQSIERGPEVPYPPLEFSPVSANLRFVAFSV